MTLKEVKDGYRRTIPDASDYEHAILALIINHASFYIESTDPKVHKDKGEEILRIIRTLMGASYQSGKEDEYIIAEMNENTAKNEKEEKLKNND